MAGRTKQKAAAPQSPDEARHRIGRAVQEGRFQHALELTKRLHADKPTPETRQLLIEIYFGRARQLREQGHTRDAVTVLGNLPALLGDAPAGRVRLAEELAACGEAPKALQLLENSPESSARAAVLAQAADQAVARGPGGQAMLPENLRDGHAAILRAFEQSYAGQDEAARETLQAIGLQSVFLEWKLLLRGLLAYYQKDDAKALENWSRLNPGRLPARLAAPLRALLDPVYRTSQPPETQAVLQRQADQLVGAGPLPQLRAIQAALANEGGVQRALRLASTLLPALKQQDPALAARLAAECYAAVILHGEPDDVSHYRRALGPPPQDAQLLRLEALGYQVHHNLPRAHARWGDYEKWVADHPEAWGQDTPRVRALIWARRGELAADMPDEKFLESLPPFLRNHPDRPRPLDPPAEVCFQKALALAPDLQDVHEAYVAYARQHRPPQEFAAAARALLERFPNHAATLKSLGEHYGEAGKWDEALPLFERALQVHPLDRQLRGSVCLAHARVARMYMESRRFPEARQHLAASLAGQEGKAPRLLAQWAICEFLAKQPDRAEQLVQQVQASAGHPVPAAYVLTAEAIRGKLPAPLKARFAAAFRAALDTAPECAAAVDALEMAAAYRYGKITYRGQKPHEQQLIAYLKRIQPTDIPEPLLVQLCAALRALKDAKLLRSYTSQGARRFPTAPVFPLLEAESYLLANPQRPQQPHRVDALLERARQLAENLPANDPERNALLEAIARTQKSLQAASLLRRPDLMLRMLEEMTGDMIHGGDDEDDDDDTFF